MKKGEMSFVEIRYELERAGCVLQIVRDSEKDAEQVTLFEFLDEPDAWMGLGAMARLGATLETIGMQLTESAKRCVSGGGSHDDDGVRFEWVDPTHYTEVDTKEVKKKYPKDDYPDLYKKASRSGYVKVMLPK